MFAYRFGKVAYKTSRSKIFIEFLRLSQVYYGKNGLKGLAVVDITVQFTQKKCHKEM